MTVTDLSPVAQSCWCFALINSCQPHIRLQQDENQADFGPWNKVLSKLNAFLSGELKSESNLQRFYDAFCDWRDQQKSEDSFNQMITDVCMATTDAAITLLFDGECDDVRLLPGSMTELYEQLEALGGPAVELEAYWNELNTEWVSLLQGVKQRPVSRDILRQLCDVSVSPFGLED